MRSRFASFSSQLADGGQNKIWKVDLLTGSYRTLTDFPTVTNPLYPIPGLGGPMIEAVPTGIIYSGGRLLVTLNSRTYFCQRFQLIGCGFGPFL